MAATPDVTRLFDDHHRSLHRYLFRLCRDADLAADGVQETFVRALENPPQHRLERAWLFKVATNVVIEQLRTHSRRQRIVAGSVARVPIGDPPLDPHDRVESIERHEAVLDALGAISDKERIAVLMREEGFSHREIAAAVDTTTGSVGTLIARALVKLADALPAYAETP